MRYPMVFEGFHEDPEASPEGTIHAHADSVDDSAASVTYHSKAGTVAAADAAPINGTRLYGTGDSASTLIGTYDATNAQWTASGSDPAPAAAAADAISLTELQDFPGLQGLDLSKLSINFGISDELANDLDGTTFGTFLFHAVNDYLDVTHKVKDAAEISSINNYVKSLQRDENARLVKLSDKFSNNVLTTKEMYMMVNRDAHQIRSNIRLVLYAMVFASAVMALMPFHQTTWAKVLIGLAILLFFTYTVLYIRKDRSRRFKDFSKYFFRKGDLSDTPTSETANALEDEDEEGVC